MLSLGRFSHCITRVAADYSCNKTIYRTTLRLSVRRYANVLNNMGIDENGEVKLKIDPKVEELDDKLIYCDYIERKKLKFGYKKNKKIENAIKYKASLEKLDTLLNEPTYSIALKYLRPNLNSNEENLEEDLEYEKKSDRQSKIHMPYASTDKFEKVAIEDEKNKTEENELNCNIPYKDLNQQYKKLYDAYLAAKKVKNSKNLMKSEKFEDLEEMILEMESRRPADNLNVVPKNWMADYEQYDEVSEEDAPWESLYGTANSKIPVSDVPCGGCGASLHCQDPAIPGYLPSELFSGLKNVDLKNIICQRCHFMEHYNATLEVKVAPEVYPEILSNIELRKKKAAVILMIDLTDFPCSIWQNLPTIIGRNTNIFVVGNKIDLLPMDGPRFTNNVKNSLIEALEKSGLKKFNIKHVELISAKTGYGVERLINKLHSIWAYKGDVYMIGCTNVGKSTLFNALLQSDYCKVQAVDIIRRATTSPWPGTTLNLLKFPILNPVRWRLYMRTLRRTAESEDIHAEMIFNRRQVTANKDISFATLQERIGRTFTPSALTGPALAKYEKRMSSGYKFGLDENDPEYKDGRWCYDTPGVIHPDQVLHLLTTQELMLTLPRKIISPRSFIFKPEQTLFLAGLGRLDLLKGPEYIRITVFASDRLPITICPTNDAENIYNTLLHTDALTVPINDPERLKIWPALVPKVYKMTGISKNESVGDILLSSAGWIAITPDEGQEVILKAWTPEGRGIYVRKPALLSRSISLRGPRIKSSAAYRCGRQVYNKP